MEEAKQEEIFIADVAPDQIISGSALDQVDQFREQAMKASTNMDLVEAKEEMKTLMDDVSAAQSRLDQVAKSAMDLQRDLAQANDRSLVFNAEQHPDMDKEALLIAAQAHLRQCRCRNKAGEPWPLWSTKADDLGEYGTGIALYFRFTISLSMTVLLGAFLTLPLLLLNFTGTGLTEVDVGTGEHGIFATSSIGNFLSSSGSISLSRFDITPADVATLVGLLDALAIAAVALLAIWFERVALPAAVKAEALTIVTPDDYSIFVSNLPRRLPGELHQQYEQLLQEHFERQLSAEVTPGLQLQHFKVISQEEQFLYDPPKKSCFSYCTRGSKDYRGRKVGVIASVEGSSCLVRWPDHRGNLGLAEEVAVDRPSDATDGVKAPGLLQADLLTRLEEMGCQPPQGGRQAVYKVSLIRDFRGKLHSMRKVVERAKKIGEQENPSQREAQEQADAEEELNNLDLEDKDVLGAFVTFTFIHFKDFVSQEYRFSRLLGLGPWLQGPDQRFGERALRIYPAPLPSDIFWENFDCPTTKRRLKTLLMGITFLLVLLVMVLGLSLAKWGREQAQAQSPDCSIYNATVLASNASDVPVDCYCASVGIANLLQDKPAGIMETCQSYLQTFAYVQGMIVGAAIFSSVINLASGHLIAVLAHFMQPPNWTALEARIMEMTFLVQLLTLGVVVTLVNADFQFGLGAEKGILGLIGAGDFQDIDRAWTAAVGVEILMLFIFSISSEAVAASCVLWFKFSCWCFSGRKKTWKDMKALFTPPEFELALRQASQLSAVCAALMYSSCLPIMTLILAVRLFAMYWTSKFELLRGSSIPKRFSHVLALSASRWVQVAVFCHSAVAVWVYGDADLTGTTHLMFDTTEANTYVQEVGKLLGNQLSIVLKIVVEKAMTPAAMPNAVILALFMLMWGMKLFSFFLGDAEWQQLKSAVQNLFAKVIPWRLGGSQRRSIFERRFDEAPMQEMLRMKINPSYELYRAEGFEFLKPGDGERSIQEILAEAKRQKEEEAKQLLARKHTVDEKQQFLPVQVVGNATETE
ncbi:unnamed protein product [Durusdinium trenchii]|uniref:Uncharacterized protein n=1 Tax=Durusdinium trenchii TaxID=1381693 RepID=A0ABP0R2K0_9DINO